MATLSARVYPDSFGTTDFTASTNIRDVSNLLDVWAHEETPLLNRISWGPDSGGTIIEWLTEHRGFGYVQTSAAIASDTSAILITTSGTGLATAEVAKAIQVGTLLYAKTAGSTEYAYFVVTTINTGAGSLGLSELVTVSGGVAASAKLYIVGHFAPEGSDPMGDTSRKRAIMSNKFAIHMKEVSITGSMLATDMYAVPNNLAHEIKQRLQEMQFERERSVLLSYGQSRSSTTAIGLMNGAFGCIINSGLLGTSPYDNTTTTFTESAFNNLVANIVENGGSPKVVVGPYTLMRKFTDWSRDRVRMAPDNKIGGLFIPRYMTDVGKELELLMMPKFPATLVFVLDTDKLKLRAKKGRKLLLKKLGDNGDYEQHMLISEYSMEGRGFEWGQHGVFTALTS
jgi:hypothetical protein